MSETIKKVGLFGIEGVYNFGCEAIVRGTYNFVKDIYPNSHVIYFSFSYDYDVSILNDLDITIVSIHKEYFSLKRGINKLAKLLNINKRFLMYDYKKIIEMVDVFISIGGDIYTIPTIIRKQAKYSYYNSLVDFCNRAINSGKDIVVYGGSIGPWGFYKSAVNYYVNSLKRYKIILCREEESVKYLNAIGLNNVTFFPDPAFQLKGKNENIENRYIGINFSPLSFNEVFGNHNIGHVRKIALLLDRLYEELKMELIFIPHVISQDVNDNDLIFMQQIKNKMKHDNIVSFSNYNQGFYGAKKDIKKCKLVIAARMHCAINAIDECIPAIFVSYSQKSIGMCQYIYGNTDFLVDLRKIDEKLIEVVRNVLKNNNEIKNRIINRNHEIEQYYKNNITKIKTNGIL